MKLAFGILILSGFFNYSYARGMTKKDTVFYYIDTLKTPVKDRMISVEMDKAFKFYTINCYCLSSDNPPVFRTNVTKQTLLSKSEFKKLTFISLTRLIELVRKNDDRHFDEKYVIYFIEPAGNKYAKLKAFFLGGHVTILN